MPNKKSPVPPRERPVKLPPYKSYSGQLSLEGLRAAIETLQARPEERSRRLLNQGRLGKGTHLLTPDDMRSGYFTPWSSYWQEEERRGKAPSLPDWSKK